MHNEAHQHIQMILMMIHLLQIRLFYQPNDESNYKVVDETDATKPTHC
jgi:hypothetical protein